MSYQKPDFIQYNVLKEGSEVLDDRMTFTTKLLEEAPLDSIKDVLDIGMGSGEFSIWFSKKGKSVTGTGKSFDSYNMDYDLLNKYGIKTIEYDVDKMPFADKSFDAVLLSHVLEHCFDVSVVLKEIRRVLRDDGYLFIFLPEYSSIVYGGHVTTGWNTGQLLMALLLNGFNVKDGMFLHKEHQLCAFVQKSLIPLPALRCDSGDNSILFNAGFFPTELKFMDSNNDYFEGNIQSINWGSDIKMDITFSKKQKLIIGLSKVIPKVLLKKIIFYVKIIITTLNDYWFKTK
jgi:2-polyprenyl-3-methyl-5-hydroxy-6-metoxy-1,4-benzoquinol methylase